MTDNTYSPMTDDSASAILTSLDVNNAEVHPETMKKLRGAMPWSTRIPASIARAKELTAERPYWMFIQGEYPALNNYLTATEVALAEALWGHLDSFGAWARADEPSVQEWIHETQEALREFTTKVESLG